MTSWGSSETCVGVLLPVEISRRDSATICSNGGCTEVSVGMVVAASGESSNPTMRTSSGTRNPSVCNATIAPKATASSVHTRASGLLSLVNSRIEQS